MLDKLYIRRRAGRRVSRSAKFAPLFAVSALLLLIAAVALHRFNLILQPDLVFGVALSVFCASLALLLAAKAVYNLWRSGDVGGRKALRTTLIAVLTLLPVVLYLAQLSASPRIHDVSTDLEIPVQFNTVMGNMQDTLAEEQRDGRTKFMSALGLSDLIVHNSLGAEAASDVLQQISAYPEVSGRQYDSAQDHVLKAVIKTLKTQGYVVTDISGPHARSIDVNVEAIARSFVLGLYSDLVVRVRDEAEQTTVDMRSVSRYGRYDLGMNAQIITAFFEALDLEMRNAVPDAPEE